MNRNHSDNESVFFRTIPKLGSLAFRAVLIVVLAVLLRGAVLIIGKSIDGRDPTDPKGDCSRIQIGMTAQQVLPQVSQMSLERQFRYERIRSAEDGGETIELTRPTGTCVIKLDNAGKVFQTEVRNDLSWSEME